MTNNCAILVYLVFLLMTNFNCSAQAKQEESSKWTKCSTSRDCEIAEGGCGMPAAINKKYKSELDNIRASTSCAASMNFKTISKNEITVCEKGVCVIKEQQAAH